MVQSFVSTQKQSVQRSMTRKFAQFVSVRGDNYELVLTVLRGMLRDQRRLADRGMMPAGVDPDHISSRCLVVALLHPATCCGPATTSRRGGHVHCPCCPGPQDTDFAPLMQNLTKSTGPSRSGCGSTEWWTSAASTTAPPLAPAASSWSPPTTLQSGSSPMPDNAPGCSSWGWAHACMGFIGQMYRG